MWSSALLSATEGVEPSASGKPAQRTAMLNLCPALPRSPDWKPRAGGGVSRSLPTTASTMAGGELETIEFQSLKSGEASPQVYQGHLVDCVMVNGAVGPSLYV